MMVSVCAPTGNASGQGAEVAALRGDQLAEPVHRGAVRQRLRRVDAVDARGVEHLGGQRERQLHHVVRAAAGQHLQRLGDLDGVADGTAQRRRHVGQQRARRPARPRCRARPWCGPAHGDSASVFRNAPEPTLQSSTSALAPSAIFLLITELAISGSDSVVPVTSRSA